MIEYEAKCFKINTHLEGVLAMKKGLTIDRLASEVTRQQEAKRDFVLDTRDLRFNAMSGSLNVMIEQPNGETESFGITNDAHNQIGTYLGINQKYYQKMMAYEPGLLAVNVNQWFQRTEKPFNAEPRMVRVLDGNMRAFLSNRYQRIDNFDLLMALMPVFQQFPGLQFESNSLSEREMFLKVFWPGNQKEVKKGDIIQAGCVIRNSETGFASTSVKPMSLRLWCMNGATHDEYGAKKVHRGKRIDVNETSYELFTDETLAMSDKAFIMQIRDLVKSTLQGVWLDTVVRQMQEAQGIPVEDPKTAVQELGKRFLFSEEEQELTLEHFFRDLAHNGQTQYGLFNAVTRMAQDVESYERATELEEIGGQVLLMSL